MPPRLFLTDKTRLFTGGITVLK